ncbi:hypothetical protein AAC387_Pa07g2215 [Persea americana]
MRRGGNEMENSEWRHFSFRLSLLFRPLHTRGRDQAREICTQQQQGGEGERSGEGEECSSRAVRERNSRAAKERRAGAREIPARGRDQARERRKTEERHPREKIARSKIRGKRKMGRLIVL